MLPAQIHELNEVFARLLSECLERWQKRDKAKEGVDYDEEEQDQMDVENEEEDEFLGYIYHSVARLVHLNKQIYIEDFQQVLLPVFEAMLVRWTIICVVYV